MSPILQIIELFGGQAEMARKLEHKNPTTIAGWKKSGRIPAWRMFEISEAAKRHGIDLPNEIFKARLNSVSAAEGDAA